MKLNLIARACAVALTLSIASMPAFAKLAAGAPAPDFSAPAALAGKTFTFALADARLVQVVANLAPDQGRVAGRGRAAGALVGTLRRVGAAARRRARARYPRT